MAGYFLCYDKGVSETERVDGWTEPPLPFVEVCSSLLYSIVQVSAGAFRCVCVCISSDQ